MQYNNLRFEPDPPYSDDELLRIRECCSTLLSQWAVVRRKDKNSRKLWDDIANARFLPRIRENLEEVGYELVITEAQGREVAYLKGDKPQMRVKFKKAETIVILRMYQLLRNNRTKASLLQTGCVVDVRDLYNAVVAHQKVVLKEDDIKRILYDLERYQLCRIDEKRKKNFSFNTQIVILPAVECMIGDKPVGWELEMLNQFKQERADQREDDTSDDTEEGGDENGD